VPRLWDDSLYEGSAGHYRVGRLPYPQRLADALRDRLDLDGTGRLLDLGCGPGSLTLLVAPMFSWVVAVDADDDMVRVASDEAARQDIENVHWIHAYAEDLEPPDLPFDVVTLAQSFHWMDRPVVARNIRSWLAPDGCCVHVGATTHESAAGASGLPYPMPPRDRIRDLVRSYLGADRRAGRQVVTGGETSGGEDVVFRAAGFIGPEVLHVPGGDCFLRTEDEVVASVLSLSSAAPHLFADRLEDFLDDLRSLLRDSSPERVFSEQLQDISLHLWSLGRLGVS
jgi:SAM-dependent methyltransferase